MRGRFENERSKLKPWKVSELAFSFHSRCPELSQEDRRAQVLLTTTTTTSSVALSVT